MIASRCGHQFRRQIQQMHNELVRVLPLNPISAQGICGEVPQICSDNHIGAAPNRGGEHVPVVRIGKLQALDQILIAAHQRIPCVQIHERSSSLQLLARQIGAAA